MIDEDHEIQNEVAKTEEEDHPVMIELDEAPIMEGGILNTDTTYKFF